MQAEEEPFAGQADCARRVMQLLSPRAVGASSVVCRAWAAYARDEAIWEQKYEETWGPMPEAVRGALGVGKAAVPSSSVGRAFSWQKRFRVLANGTDVWQAASRETLHSAVRRASQLHLGIHAADNLCLAFLPGRSARLAVGGADGCIRVWQQHTIMGCSEDGKAKCVQRWGRDPHGQPAYKVTRAHAGMITGVESLGSGKIMSAGSDGTIRVFEAVPSARVPAPSTSPVDNAYKLAGGMRTTHTHALNAIALPHVPDATLHDSPSKVATVGDDGLLLIHDMMNLQTACKVETSGTPLPLHACAWVGYSNELVCTGGSDRVARVWDLRVAQQVGEMQPAIRNTDLGGRSERVAGILALAAPEVEQHLICTGHACGCIAMWDSRMWRTLHIVNQGHSVQSLQALDGILVAATSDGKLWQYNLMRMRLQGHLAVHPLHGNGLSSGANITCKPFLWACRLTPGHFATCAAGGAAWVFSTSSKAAIHSPEESAWEPFSGEEDVTKFDFSGREPSARVSFTAVHGPDRGGEHHRITVGRRVAATAANLEAVQTLSREFVNSVCL